MVPIDFRDLSHFIPLEFYISLSSPPGPRDPSLSADRRGVETMETMGSAASRSSPKLGLKTLVKVWATGRLWYLLISYGHFQWTGYDILWYLMVIFSERDMPWFDAILKGTSWKNPTNRWWRSLFWATGFHSAGFFLASTWIQSFGHNPCAFCG